MSATKDPADPPPEAQPAQQPRSQSQPTAVMVYPQGQTQSQQTEIILMPEGNCPNCHVGYIRPTLNICALLCIICLFPIGLVFLLLALYFEIEINTAPKMRCFRLDNRFYGMKERITFSSFKNKWAKEQTIVFQIFQNMLHSPQSIFAVTGVSNVQAVVSLLEDDLYDDTFRNSFQPVLDSGSISQRIDPSTRDAHKPLVYLATVICSRRLIEGLTMLKTAIFFSKEANLYFLVFTDANNQGKLTYELAELAQKADQLNISLEYELRPVFIDPKHGRKWHLMFAPCSTQRLFFPQTLPHIGELMYLDTDVMFLSSITDMWKEFSKMKPVHLAAVAPEHELPGDGWYNRKSLIPYYGPRGLNTGTMLMNLTAMRSFDITEKMATIAESYGDTIHWADQDMMNILFHFYPYTLHEIGCEFNYRVQHCLCDFPKSGDCGCRNAEKNGISIFHGNRGTFHKKRFIKNIYNAFRKMSLTAPPQDILEQLKRDYKNIDSKLPCGNISNALFSRFQRYVTLTSED
ncbi:unnamed protein product [Allacma fusca]|uniref:Glucoside xylosyltransferase 2 n=1 Tax=Allacma fusca TaxID=39272 RepID=A0A8J2KNC6_9HEXA|nr:unnamed protein product [Allacma fusca]